MSLNDFFVIAAFVTIGILIITMWPVTYLFVTLHYDKLFPETKKDKNAVYRNIGSLNPLLYFVRGATRGSCYLVCILCYNIKKKRVTIFGDFYPEYYHNYDWRKNARLIDWIIIWITAVSILVITVCIISSSLIQDNIL